MKKILIVNPFGIGDVLFTTPIIHTLKEAFPGTKIGYLCNRRTATILRDNPYLDSIFIYERDDFEAIRRKSFFPWLASFLIFLNRIKKERFDLALDFSLNTQFGFFCWYAGIRRRIGYNFKQRGKFLTQKLPLAGYKDKHIVEYYAELLKLINLELKYRKLELYPSKNDLRKIEADLKKEGAESQDLLVGIVPGGGQSWGKDAYLKHWPAEKFAELGDKIIENYQAKIIIMGDFSEQVIAQKVKETMHHKAIDFSGRTTLSELSALLTKMKLVVTNDGGPLHMAVALGIKAVSIFGPVDDLVYGPYPPSPGHIVIKEDLACQPCYQNFRLSECERKSECLSNISVEDVFAAVRRLW